MKFQQADYVDPADGWGLYTDDKPMTFKNKEGEMSIQDVFKSLLEMMKVDSTSDVPDGFWDYWEKETPMKFPKEGETKATTAETKEEQAKKELIEKGKQKEATKGKAVDKLTTAIPLEKRILGLLGGNIKEPIRNYQDLNTNQRAVYDKILNRQPITNDSMKGLYDDLFEKIRGNLDTTGMFSKTPDDVKDILAVKYAGKTLNNMLDAQTSQSNNTNTSLATMLNSLFYKDSNDEIAFKTDTENYKAKLDHKSNLINALANFLKAQKLGESTSIKIKNSKGKQTGKEEKVPLSQQGFSYDQNKVQKLRELFKEE
jgi:hypothetical protein